MITLEQTLKVARSQIGYNGGGTEDAPDTKFGVWMGFNPAQWCASFVSWVLANGGTDIAGSPITGFEYPKGFAWCPAGVSSFQALGTYSTDMTTVRGGDVGFQDFGLGRASHTWIADTDYDPATGGFWTIQGNTTDTSIGRTGNCCRRKFVVAADFHNWGRGRPAYAAAPTISPAHPTTAFTLEDIMTLPGTPTGLTYQKLVDDIARASVALLLTDANKGVNLVNGASYHDHIAAQTNRAARLVDAITGPDGVLPTLTEANTGIKAYVAKIARKIKAA